MYFLTIKFAFSPTKKRGTPPQIALTRHTSLYIFILDWSVQLRARRDVVVHHEEVQLLVLAVLQIVDGREQHAAGLDAHHGARRAVLYLDRAEITLREGLKVYGLLEQRLYLDLRKVNLCIRREETFLSLRCLFRLSRVLSEGLHGREVG